MTKEPSLDLLDQVSSLCDDKSSLQARFALASYPDHSRDSIITGKGLMLFEYLQLVSPLLIATIILDFNQDSALFRALFFLARLINPAYWMSFNKAGTLENMLLILVCIFTMVKVLLFLYILYRCTGSTEVPEGRLVTVWRLLMKFQSRITYFYVSSFYIAAIRVVDWENYQTKDNEDIGIQITAFILIALELLLALVPKIYYHDMLPTKNFLSAKENTLEITALLQKALTQILTGTLHSKISDYNWVLTSLNICIDVFRITNLFIRLPFYSFKALYFQGRLLMVVASLNLAYFVSLVVKEISPDLHSLALSLIIWGVLLIFSITVSNNFLKKAYWRIICDPSLDSPNLLAHRVVAIKELQRSTVMNCAQNHDKSDFNLLVWKTFNSHMKRILWAHDDDSTSSMNVLFQNFLERLQEKFPQNKFIKIFLAEFYFKKIKVYGDPIKICLSLQRSHNKKVKINAELLLIKIQNQIKKKTLNDFHPLDLLNFVSEHSFIAKLKQKMQRQARFQAEICSEIMTDSPNLELIYQNSQKAHFQRGNIMKEISQISTRISDFNIEPLLLSAEYSLHLNHSVGDYLYFTKLSSQKLQKYKKSFAQEKLCPENVFQESAGFLRISGVKGEAGKVIYATKQIGDILGGDPSQYSGIFLPQRTPPIFRRILTEKWKQMSENPETSSFGKINRSFFYHIDGYLVEIEYFIDIHPFTTQGFAFIFIFRPVVSNREYLLLYENGDIDSASKGLIERLSLELKVKRINIGDLNEELTKVNEAFNVMAFPQKYGVEELEEAKETYFKYSTEGVSILLKSQHNPDMSYSYNCKIKNLAFGSFLIKVLTFEANQKEIQTYGQLSQRNASEETTQKQYPPITERTLLTDTQRDCPNSTERQLITFNSRAKLPNSTRPFPKDHPEELGSSSDHDTPDENDEEVIYRKAKTQKNLGQISQEKRVSSLYQVSLDSQYYSKTFRGLSGGFYFALIVLIILRILLKVISVNYMDSLVAKKDIFSNNGYRSYILIETSGLARYVWQFTSGALNLSDYSADFAQSLNITKLFVIANIQNLREANRVLLKASSVLSSEAQEALFNPLTAARQRNETRRKF